MLTTVSDIGCEADKNLLKKGKSEEQCAWFLYKQRLIHLIKTCETLRQAACTYSQSRPR